MENGSNNYFFALTFKRSKYPSYAKVTIDGVEKLHVVTQLYSIGVYIALYDGNNSLIEQGNYSPAQAKKYMNQFKLDNIKGNNVVSEFGEDILVHEVNGLWEQIK